MAKVAMGKDAKISSPENVKPVTEINGKTVVDTRKIRMGENPHKKVEKEEAKKAEPKKTK